MSEIKDNAKPNEAYAKAREENRATERAEKLDRAIHAIELIEELAAAHARGEKLDTAATFRKVAEGFCTCAKRLQRHREAHALLKADQHGDVCELAWTEAVLPYDCVRGIVDLCKMVFTNDDANQIPHEILTSIAGHLDQSAMSFRMLTVASALKH